MFDEVTKQKRGRPAARSGAYVAASAVLQTLCVLVVLFVVDRLRAAATGSAPLVAVKFIRAPPSAPPAPPPLGTERRAPPRPRVTPPRAPPPTALIQPKEIPAQLAPPSLEEPEPTGIGIDEGGAEGGGGADRGIVGGLPGGVAPGGGGTGDEPVFPAAGFRKPAQAIRNCVQDAIRVPRDLQGFVSGPVAAKFAIRKDGTPAYFQMVTEVPDRRIADAIWQAVTSCRWIPGADAEGRSTSIWVILPIRFRSG